MAECHDGVLVEARLEHAVERISCRHTGGACISTQALSACRTVGGIHKEKHLREAPRAPRLMCGKTVLQRRPVCHVQTLALAIRVMRRRVVDLL
eukprot:5448136-Pleurochrysis_carterae.AAC.1